VIPAGLKVLAVEAGVRDSLAALTGSVDRVLGMHSFGASAPASQLFQHFGITAERLVEMALA
jgi:transketolase